MEGLAESTAELSLKQDDAKVYFELNRNPSNQYDTSGSLNMTVVAKKARDQMKIYSNELKKKEVWEKRF
ncbi:uncharacterized protein PHALS_07529 [Plasmopara halstedii]|uniref:Uncharacterized protein n=1 Tax=Plasmopara halstedii TaxID=4781 RepID=A0A0P1B5R3_PLAHL|nr:uncharacterized protein PHALS_07529 [Plasmopara halstedii]CEG49783.1 hypothetical protein PHALS_07529 [Plasmopara halstedii]|eukprot:XP_024586152.1 hypothetical protein PHALS_07529 [Plasmopara halstedii]